MVAAVVLERRIRGLKDSKLLSKKERERLSLIIHERAVSIGIAWIQPADVDRLGLTAATKLAAEQAVAQITCKYEEIIIDGNFNYLKGNPKAKARIKADMTVAAVSAASIVAKVARDNYMAEIAPKFPHYKFEQNVGYGTKHHREMLAVHGACELHRVSWRPFQEPSGV